LVRSQAAISVELTVHDELETIDGQAIGPLFELFPSHHTGLNVYKGLDDFHLSIDGKIRVFHRHILPIRVPTIMI
jgi:hypothetical protein